MKILFCCDDTRPEAWIAGLRAARPGDEVMLWAPGAPAADYAVVWAPPQQMLDEQPQLKAMFNIGAGVDALLPLRVAPGTLVVRLDDAGMAAQMAEFVCHALIRHFRELDLIEADARAGRWGSRKPRRRAEFAVGVLGLGVLGQRVAQAMRLFDFPVLGWSRTPRGHEAALAGVRCFSGADQLDDFLRGCRALVCLLPLTEDTRDILNARHLSLLQPGAYVVNVARGGHLVDQDLLTLLDSGHLAGATLDVFRTEPLPEAHPFWRHPRITITPHTSARTLREESIAQIVGKMAKLERGETVAGVVDLQRGY